MQLAIKPIKITTSFLVFSITFLVLNQRPAILQAVGELVFASLLAAMGFYFYLGGKVYLNRRKRIFLVFAALLSLYLFAQGVLLQTAVTVNLLINVSFIFVSSLAILFISENRWTIALKAFIYPVLFFCVSYLITTLTVVLVGGSLDRLALVSFELIQGGSKYFITIYFPFSPALGFGNSNFFGLSIARAIGHFREPGIFQILVIASFFGLDFIELNRKKIWKALLLFTLVLTFSTAGIGSFVAAFLYYYVVARREGGVSSRYKSVWLLLSRTFYLVITFGIGYWFVFTEQKFGLMRKLHFASGSVRVEAASDALTQFSEHPLFGVGYLNPSVSGLTFSSMFAQIGLVGAILIVLMILAPNWELIKNRHPVLVLLIPVVLTMLMAQPLFDKPLLYIFIALVVAYPIKDTPASGTELKSGGAE